MPVIDSFGYPKQIQEIQTEGDPDLKSCEFCSFPNSISEDAKCALCGSTDWKSRTKTYKTY